MATIERDAPVAFRNQVLGRQACAVLVIQEQSIPVIARSDVAAHFAVEQQQRRLSADGGEDLLRIATLCRREDDASGSVLHQRTEHSQLTLGRFTGASEQGDETRVAKNFVNARREFGEEGVGQVVEHQRDARRRAPAQICRRTVIDIALPPQLFFDASAGVLVDQRAAPQHQGNGGAGDVATCCNVAKGDLAADRRCVPHLSVILGFGTIQIYLNWRNCDHAVQHAQNGRQC